MFQFSYTWMQMPDHEWERINRDESQPYRTPTLVGCALAADRENFFKMGGFDDAFNIWGGENIEIAWRYWICGGGAYSHPCSRIAHTFKPFALKFDGDREKVVQKNLMRTAELWMGDWVKYFYASTYSWPTKHTYFTEEDRKTLEIRHQLRRDLKCKDFTWYMETVFPEVPRPKDNAIYYGEVTNYKSEACWVIADDGYIALTYFCFFHRILPENIFYVDTAGRMHYKDGRCVRVDYAHYLLRLDECEQVYPGELALEHWSMDHTGPVKGLLKVRLPRKHHGIVDKENVHTLCVLQVTNVNPIHYREQMPQLTDCDFKKGFSYWRWTYKFDFNYNFDQPF